MKKRLRLQSNLDSGTASNEEKEFTSQFPAVFKVKKPAVKKPTGRRTSSGKP
jgi:hypothetical protein